MDDQRAASRPNPYGISAQMFAEQLRALRTAVGSPSFRKMAGRSGRISHTTLHEAASGTRFPSWETTREFVRACDADEVQWRRRWEDAQRAATIHGTSHDDPAQVMAGSPAGADAADTSGTMTTGDVAAESSQATRSPSAGGPVVSGTAASPDHPPDGRRPPRVAGNRQAAEGEVPDARPQRIPWLAAASVVVVVAVATVVGVAVRGLSSPNGSGTVAASPSSTRVSDALVPGDASMFIADVTIPDGTRVRVNETFDKVWALANVGEVAWHHRYLARLNGARDDNGCRVPDRVAIGDTLPGERVMISVEVTAPSRPGTCWVGWKMVDEHGREFFPSRRPVYFLVTVTN